MPDIGVLVTTDPTHQVLRVDHAGQLLSARGPLESRHLTEILGLAPDALPPAHEAATVRHVVAPDLGELTVRSFPKPGGELQVLVTEAAPREVLDEKRRLNFVLDGTRVGSWEWNVQTGETRFNERWAEIIGYTLSELEPVSIETWMAHAYGPDLEASNQQLQEVFRGERDYYDIDCRMHHRDGHLVWVHDRGAVFEWTEDGQPLMMYGTHQDISARKQAEAEIAALMAREARDARTTALGRMAAGIAHDFNNLLQSISGHADLLLETLETSTHEAQSAERILEAADRAQSLTGQILDYTGVATTPTEPFAVVSVVREVVALTRKGAAAKIDVQLRAERDDLVALGDASQIHQVLMNLVRNALEASTPPASVRVTVEAQELTAQTLEAERIHRQERRLEPGRYVVVTVTDEGPGIDAADAERIFDPFFSTKFIGRGLGLASVYGILTRHDAGLLLDSAPGEGTRVRVLLPPARAPIPAKRAVRRFDCRAGWSRAARALVVDDEPNVRAVVCRLLQSRGFEVIDAPDAADALARVRAEGDAIGILFTDLVMPGMSGLELHEALRAEGHAVPVVLMSGYSDELVAERASAQRPPVLVKPFNARDLDVTLNDVAARAAGD